MFLLNVYSFIDIKQKRNQTVRVIIILIILNLPRRLNSNLKYKIYKNILTNINHFTSDIMVKL